MTFVVVCDRCGTGCLNDASRVKRRCINGVKPKRLVASIKDVAPNSSRYLNRPAVRARLLEIQRVLLRAHHGRAATRRDTQKLVGVRICLECRPFTSEGVRAWTDVGELRGKRFLLPVRTRRGLQEFLRAKFSRWAARAERPYSSLDCERPPVYASLAVEG